MSVSFIWTIVDPSKDRIFRHGTSSDIEPLKETFPDGVSTKDIPTLRAMHRASGLNASLWSEIADTLERLQGENYDEEIKLEIWTQF